MIYTMGPGAVSARGASNTTMRDAAEAIRKSRSPDGAISRDSTVRCASELAAIFRRGTNDAQNRGEHVDRRIGAIYALLGITTAQARATDGRASETVANALATALLGVTTARARATYDGASETVANALETRCDGGIAQRHRGGHDHARDRARSHRDARDRDRARERETASTPVASQARSPRSRSRDRPSRGLAPS